MSTISDVLAVLSVLIGIAIIIDIVLSESATSKVKTQIIRAWLRVGEYDVTSSLRNVKEQCSDLFQAVYGARHVSFRCIVASCLASLLAILLSVTCLYVFTDARLTFGRFTDVDSFFSVLYNFIAAFVSTPLLGFLLLQNLIVDYISLIETRVVLKYAKASSLPGLGRLLLIDLVLTTSIVLAPMAFAYLSVLPLLNSGWLFDSGTVVATNLRSFSDLLGVVTLAPGTKQVAAPLFYSTFFTSAVFYLMIIATLLVRLLHRMKAPILRVLEWLEKQRAPTTTVLAILAAFIGIVSSAHQLVAPDESAVATSAGSEGSDVAVSSPPFTNLTGNPHVEEVLVGRHPVRFTYWGKPAKSGPDEFRGLYTPPTLVGEVDIRKQGDALRVQSVIGSKEPAFAFEGHITSAEPVDLHDGHLITFVGNVRFDVTSRYDVSIAFDREGAIQLEAVSSRARGWELLETALDDRGYSERVLRLTIMF